MAIRNILNETEEALRKKSRPVTDFGARLHTLLDDMKETLALADGAGLAAPQVGVLRRVVVVGFGEDVLELVNPELLGGEGEQEGAEGCLSSPGEYGVVKRPAKVRVRAQTRDGDFFEFEAEDLPARCFCHEIDHLNGVLFKDLALRMLSPEEVEAMRSGGDEDEEEEVGGNA